jgi:hypothetical protein
MVFGLASSQPDLSPFPSLKISADPGDAITGNFSA